MTAHGKFFSTITRCLLFSVAMAVLGLTWGCGGEVPSQATLDEAATGRVKEAQDAQKEFMLKKMAAKKSARKGATGGP